tara:strand:+ start:1607 stop:1873 length:267 start_codon:yes stop_codon:yes gene_type:complete
LEYIYVLQKFIKFGHKMDEKKIIRIVSKALKKKISLKSTSSNTEEWDSLGHLSIMAAFGKETKGASSKIDLTEVDSVKNFISKLKKIK